MSDEKFNLNVFDEEIESCCNITKTGFFRNGKCESSKEDIGSVSYTHLTLPTMMSV